jgi:ABC-type Zn uptake system ZnuABC Zn-binding protein ZnuA
LGLGITTTGCPAPGFAAGKPLNILCTTFPVYQLTRNVVQGRKAVSVELMLPAQFGCPHDYALTPQDLRKLSKADVLVVNGLGLEEFLGAPVKKANPRLKIVDSSQGIQEILLYTEEETGPEGKPGLERRPSVANPHLFAGPRMAGLLALNIGEGLAQIDPDGAEAYRNNARAYQNRMNKLADQFADLGRQLKNNRIVTQHGVFDYLARDMGLKIVAVVEDHAGREPSAAEILKILERVKKKKAGAVFTEPQYPEKIGRTLAKETGLPVAVLDPVAGGPENALLDYYESVMQKNMETLKKVLGVR